jgi:hypothetical protein
MGSEGGQQQGDHQAGAEGGRQVALQGVELALSQQVGAGTLVDVRTRRALAPVGAAAFDAPTLDAARRPGGGRARMS